MKPLGVLKRRTPLESWADLRLSSILHPDIPSETNAYFEWRYANQPRFFFDGAANLKEAAVIGQGSVSLADEILQGLFPFFGYSANLGFPPQWQREPFTKRIAPSGHWSELDEFSFGDIKLWWEPSRFSWAYALSRAFALTGNNIYAETFWQLLESWLDENPPNQGVNWKCGQEASLRVMTICFSCYAFRGAPASTPSRLAQLTLAIYAHGRRIDAYADYAISQKNNHGITEGAGLWTIGVLFPEFREAERWKARGRAMLESEIQRQVYDDGSYIQHSTNYHRFMLQTAAWAIRLGEVNQDKLAPGIYERVRKSLSLLYSITDPESGWAPNYGANDGALALQLSDCAFPDMRPALQSCNWLVNKQRLYPHGPWDEESAWLNGVESLKAAAGISSPHPVDLIAASGGYFTLRSATSWAFLRGVRYVDRPSQADQLHVDLWWRGENVLCDPGTYSYNAPRPFDHGFGATRYHNTVTVDGADQMTKLGRFLWTDWADCRVSPRPALASQIKVLEGEHSGYSQLGVIHRRALACLDGSVWVIVDDLSGQHAHTAYLQWLLPDCSFEMVNPGIVDLGLSAGCARVAILASTATAIDLVRAGQRVAGEPDNPVDPSRGWISRYYARKEPALSMTAECKSQLPVRFVTVVMLGNRIPLSADKHLQSISCGSTSIHLSATGESPIFTDHS